MNKVYRLIKNHVSGMVQVAPENARSYGKGRRLAIAAVAFATLTAGNGAWATDYTVPPNLTSTLTLIGTDTLTVNSGASINVTSGNAVDTNGTGNTISNAGTISSTAFTGLGIYNTGTITTLSNSGTITATDSIAIRNQGGTIATFTNSDTISGEYAVYNAGTIGTLTNTGNMSSSFASGIENYGTITNLVNLGVFSGGTFTNLGIYNGNSIGALTNAQLGLTYGGDLPTSYYTYFTDSSTYGTIDFSLLGGHTLSNYGLQIADGQSYVPGTYSGVINSDQALSVTNLLAIPSLTYYLTTANGGLTWDLVIWALSSTPVLDAVIAEGNTPAIGAATVIDANPTLQSLFYSLSGNAAISDAASQTLPLLTGGNALATFDALSGINRIIQSRQVHNLGMSSGDGFYGDRHVWLKPFGSWADQDDRNAAAGFKADTWGVVLGADATSSATTRLGVAFAYAKSNVNSKSNVAPQGSDIDLYQLIGYGSHSLGADTELNFQIDAGINQNKGKRYITFASSVADSDYDSYSAHAGVGIGRTYKLSDKTGITPSLRADYTWLKEDSHKETGAGVLNLDVDSQTTEQLIVAVDGRLTHELDSRTSLTANLGVGYDFINDRAQLTSTFAGAPGQSFATYGIEPSPWIGRAGLGVVHTLQSGMELTAAYDIEARKDFTNQTASIKARWAF